MKDKRIVCLAERWVFIGDYHASTKTEKTYLSDASCIRLWGTTKGLGEIALKGPTKSTVLDYCGDVVLEPAAVVFHLRCTYAD